MDKRPENDLFTALAHPLRRRILRVMLNEEDHAIATPQKLAASFDEPLSNLSYHVRTLGDCKALRLVKTDRVGGATRHFYRCTLRVGWARKALEATKD